MFSSFLASGLTPEFTVDQVLSNYVYVFYAAFLVSFIFTPIMRSVAMYYGIIDQPDKVRKMHAEPVAYLGGVAVFLGWVAGLAISQFLRLHRVEIGFPKHLVINPSLVIGASIIILLGLWDDIKHIKPRAKIFGQILAAVSLLVFGIGTECTANILNPLASLIHGKLGLLPGPTFPDWVIIPTSCAFVIATVVACCNATNLMDGLDGLCGGVTAIIAAGFLILAVHLAMYSSGVDPRWDALRVVLGLALLGAVLGFVPYNFNPASIFMGDTGSMFLGFCCALMIILMGHNQHPKWFLASMIVFALPVLDTSLAFARRYVNKRPFFSPDRHHFHHQLVARGFSVKQTVLISYGLAIFFAILGITITYMRTRYAGAIYIVIFGCIIVAAYKMGMVHEKPKVSPRRDLSTGDLTASSSVEETNVLSIAEDKATTASAMAVPSVSTAGGFSPSEAPVR